MGRHGWVLRALAYTVASAAVGAASGVLLGSLGSFLASDVRVSVVSLLSLLAIAVGSYEFVGRRAALLQCDHETPKRWIDRGAFGWAIRNGATLGCGALSRVGFWSWYIVPLASLLSGSPVLGAAIYGTYATTRALGAWVLILVGALIAPRLGRSFDDVAIALVQRNIAFRRLAAAHLLFVGSVIAFTFGL